MQNEPPKPSESAPGQQEAAGPSSGPDVDANPEAAALSEEDLAAALEEQIDPLDLLRTENTDLNDKLLRVMAEMENLRRRTEREVKDANRYAASRFARDMLSVVDNLNRALGTFPDDARETADDSIKSLLEGVEMTQRDMVNQLAKHGVKVLEPEGEKFDPNFHEALFEVPNPDVPNNTVVQVVETGYVIADRVLRPAKVGVAKGGPKLAPQQTNPEAGDTPAPAPGGNVDRSA